MPSPVPSSPRSPKCEYKLLKDPPKSPVLKSNESFRTLLTMTTQANEFFLHHQSGVPPYRIKLEEGKAIFRDRIILIAKGETAKTFLEKIEKIVEASEFNFGKANLAKYRYGLNDLHLYPGF